MILSVFNKPGVVAAWVGGWIVGNVTFQIKIFLDKIADISYQDVMKEVDHIVIQ